MDDNNTSTSQENSKILTTKEWIALGVIICMIFFAIFYKAEKQLALSIDSPIDGARVQDKSVLISGTYSPDNAVIEYENRKMLAQNGKFEFAVFLADSVNTVRINVRDGEKSIENEITVRRPLTEKETAEIEAVRQKEIALQKKEDAEWGRSKAGRIQKKHPDWSKEDCIKLANGKIWIGMHIDMLKYSNGLPDSANPSNYGNGTQWQWCWHDWTPSCYYDNDDDGLIDSYN